jgi:FlaA1/EpsC-like NDP-sugar epimerase
MKFKTIKKLSSLDRRIKALIQVSFDWTLFFLSFFGAMLSRLEGLAFLGDAKIWATALISSLVTLFALKFFGLYRILVRYVNSDIFKPVIKSSLIAIITIYFINYVFDVGIPRSVPLIFAIYFTSSAGGFRFAARGFLRTPAPLGRRPVLIYGAGNAGRQLQSSLLQLNDYIPVAFVDDDPRLVNMKVSGLRVHPSDQVSRLVTETGAQLILLAIPSLSPARRRAITKSLDELHVEIKTIPGMSDIISGKAKISELKTVSVEDLLGRDPVEPDPNLLSKNTAGRVVMVSGAGGSIGSELCRQVVMQSPSVLVLYDVSEFALYTIAEELSESVRRLNCQTRVVPVLGSVQNRDLLEKIIRVYEIQTIYHAAAYKHVPLVEENVVEGIRNNVFGTLAIALAAKKLGVENFILISTDKAVRPTNVMGATKRIAELICQAFALETSSTIFSMVRFGNVLGSSGSVIPRFQAQIESGGPITVTHRDITRYFMTIPEAAQLVIQAGAMGQGGDVFVLDMGEPVRIMDLAFSMVRLHGLMPYECDHLDHVSPDKGDIPVCVTGLRKGEKLFEELLIGNNPTSTKHPRIMTASEVTLPLDDLMTVLSRLHQACENYDLPQIFTILRELPLDYTPNNAELSDLTRGDAPR